jgi:hypothetical protein
VGWGLLLPGKESRRLYLEAFLLLRWLCYTGLSQFESTKLMQVQFQICSDRCDKTPWVENSYHQSDQDPHGEACLQGIYEVSSDWFQPPTSLGFTQARRSYLQSASVVSKARSTVMLSADTASLGGFEKENAFQPH